jgi:hypothetical protein
LTYYKNIPAIAPQYRPEDVYINELFGGLSQLMTASRRCTTSRRSITHRGTPTPLSRPSSIPTPRAFGYFESAGAAVLGTNPDNKYPVDAFRIKKQWFLDRPARHDDHGRRGLSAGL